MESKDTCKITIEELKTAAEPMLELLRKKGHPLMVVSISGRSIELTEAIKGVPCPYDD